MKIIVKCSYELLDFNLFKMVIAFVVGLTNLYWYFANIIVSVDAQGQLIRYASGIPSFKR